MTPREEKVLDFLIREWLRFEEALEQERRVSSMLGLENTKHGHDNVARNAYIGAVAYWRSCKRTRS